MKTSSPEDRSAHAQEEPAGPPPTIRTSQDRTLCPHGLIVFVVEICARPGKSAALASGEYDLKQLHRAHAEAGNRSRQIKAPHAGKARVKHAGHGIVRSPKRVKPVFQRPRIVVAQVFDVKHAVIVGAKNVRHLAQGRRISARKDALAYPWTERRWAVASDEVQQAAPAFADGALDREPQIGVVRLANVLQHSHGDKSVKVPAHVAVIVLNELYLSVEPFVFGALPGKSELLAGNIEGLDLHAIVSGHVQAQSSPSAAGFHNLFSRTQPQLARHQIQLGPLRFFQGAVLLREIGAAVDHLRIEPEPVKIIGEIVMIVYIASRT